MRYLKIRLPGGGAHGQLAKKVPPAVKYDYTMNHEFCPQRI
jgi:hypothetical protein